ncbi:MAG: heavy-metal-associated domain-containing protein [Beijerinckiaceae bacterium]
MSESKNIELKVTGMTCQGCVAAVKRVVQKADPQAEVAIELESGKVDIQSTADAAVLKAAIEKAGYTAEAR